MCITLGRRSPLQRKRVARVGTNQWTPGRIYTTLKNNKWLCKLEEEKNLILTPQAVEWIQLRRSNLSIEPKQLLELVERIFCRMGESVSALY